MSDDLFRVTFFVKDKDLAKAKRALLGVAIDMRDEPVVNATAKGAAVVAETGGTITELLAQKLKASGVAWITIGEAREFLESIGRSPGSATYLLNAACAARILKQTDTRGTYKVVK